MGQHLIRELLASGEVVVANVRRLPPRPSLLEQEVLDAASWKPADVLDPEALSRLIASELPEVIYHLAGFASGALARQDPGAALELNAGGTMNLCLGAVRARENSSGYAPRVLVMGSGEAYGPSSGGAFTEDMPLRPASPYGLSKACQELVVHSFRRSHGLDAVVARSFNLVGPGQASHFAVSSFSRQIAAIATGAAEPVLNVGNLDVERDFVDVRDAVCGLRAMARLEGARPVYNLSSGRALSIRRLLEWLLDEAGVDPEIRVVTERVRDSEIPRMRGDSALLKQDTGWEPLVDVENSVREVYRWSETVARHAG